MTLLVCALVAFALYEHCLPVGGSFYLLLPQYIHAACEVQGVILTLALIVMYKLLLNGCICNRFLYFICKVFIESSAICTKLAKHVVVLKGKLLPMPKKILSGK